MLLSSHKKLEESSYLYKIESCISPIVDAFGFQLILSKRII